MSLEPYHYDYYYERVPYQQLQPHSLPSLRELFFNTELSMPEFAGFVSFEQRSYSHSIKTQQINS